MPRNSRLISPPQGGPGFKGHTSGRDEVGMKPSAGVYSRSPRLQTPAMLARSRHLERYNPSRLPQPPSCIALSSDTLQKPRHGSSHAFGLRRGAWQKDEEHRLVARARLKSPGQVTAWRDLDQRPASVTQLPARLLLTSHSLHTPLHLLVGQLGTLRITTCHQHRCYTRGYSRNTTEDDKHQ